MPHVVTESCIRYKTTDCVTVCPVDRFHEEPNMLVIDPMECIDCRVCIPECPVNAIYHEYDLPATLASWVDLNLELSNMWPVISEPKDPLPDWERQADVSDNRIYLEGVGGWPTAER